MRTFACAVFALVCLFKVQAHPGFVTSNLNLHICKNNGTSLLNVWTMRDNLGESCQCLISPLKETKKARDDYVYTPGLVGLHKFHTNAKSWNDARKVCIEEHAHLAIINSKEEEAALLNMLKDGSSKIVGALSPAQAYLGIHDMWHEGEWLTIFGEPLHSTGYANWSSNYLGVSQPDNFWGIQHCGTLVNSGGMDDVHCPDKYAFFCEMSMTC